METIKIVCACDDNYSQHAIALITSIFENNKSHNIEIYMLTDFFSNQTKSYLHSLEDMYQQKIMVVVIDVTLLKNLPLEGKEYQGYINLSTYYRLLIMRLFPSFSKILYLDCDMIVRGDLLPLWKTNIDNFAIAGIVDTWSKVSEGTTRLHYPLDDLYFNAGMGLYNLRFLRSLNFDYKVQKFVEDHYDWILLHDQDILNAVLHGHFKEVSLKWNVMNNAITRKCDVSPNQKLTITEDLADIKIIHYTGSIKPWHFESYHPLKREYWYYIKKSPIKGVVPVFRYHKFYDVLKNIRNNWRAFLGLSPNSFIKIK